MKKNFEEKRGKTNKNVKLTNLVPMGSSRPWAHHTLPHAASTRLPRTWKWWINYKRNLVGFPNWHVSGCQEQVGLGTRLEKSCYNHHQQHKKWSYHSVDQFSHHWQRKLSCCHSPAWSSRWNHEWTLSLVLLGTRIIWSKLLNLARQVKIGQNCEICHYVMFWTEACKNDFYSMMDFVWTVKAVFRQSVLWHILTFSDHYRSGVSMNWWTHEWTLSSTWLRTKTREC